MKPEAAIMLVHLYGAEDSAKAAQPMTDKITAYRAMQAAMDSMEDGQALSMSVDYDYDMTMTVNATGKSVKITFPDFSGYQEIYPNQMPPSAA